MNYPSSDEIREMGIPYNVTDKSWFLNHVLSMYNNIWEAGGIQLRVAKSAGYIQAVYNFFDEIFDIYKSATPEKCKDVIMAVEAYVAITDDYSEVNRIFLIHPKWSMEMEGMLAQMGKNIDGRLCFNSDDLCNLGERGFNCIYDQPERGKTVKGLAIYNKAFGNKRKMVNFNAICYNDGFCGDLINRAIFIDNGNNVSIMLPDVFAVKMALAVYQAEIYIRRYYNPDFFAERVDIDKEKEKENVLGILKDYFTPIWTKKFSKGKLPDGYEDMLYQTAYIKSRYPEVFEKIWIEDYKTECEYGYYENNELADLASRDAGNVTVGISMGESTTIAMMLDNAGKFRKIPNEVFGYKPDYEKYHFNGTGDLYNGGVAYSNAALALRNINENIDFFMLENIAKTHISITQRIPSWSDIATFMRGSKSDKRTLVDMICYEEIESRTLNGYGLISEAAKLVNMPNIKVKVHPGIAIITAIDAECNTHLKWGEKALVVYFDKDYYCAYLCINTREGLGYLTYANGFNIAEEFYKELYEVMRESVKKELKRTYLYDSFSEDELRDGYRELYQSVPKVIHQFTRCNSAVFEFHGEGCDVQPEIGIKQFNGLLDSIIYDARMAIEGMFHDEYGLDRDYSFDDVDFIYLAGAMSDHPHIREAFGKMCNKPIRISGDSETVVARGAALIDDKEITF